MTKSELIERIAMNNSHLYASDVERLVTTIFDRIKKAMIDGNRVELRGFGVFGTKKRNSRVARNPKTGASVSVQEKSVPYFKAGRILKKRINI
ncbi:MAG: integration host factor subunit beta [Alphaproteobacteria bacterium]|nr:integration host factor subunit beta [Alphaproteobacteria bacterium]